MSKGASNGTVPQTCHYGYCLSPRQYSSVVLTLFLTLLSLLLRCDHHRPSRAPLMRLGCGHRRSSRAPPRLNSQLQLPASTRARQQRRGIVFQTKARGWDNLRSQPNGKGPPTTRGTVTFTYAKHPEIKKLEMEYEEGMRTRKCVSFTGDGNVSPCLPTKKHLLQPNES